MYSETGDFFNHELHLTPTAQPQKHEVLKVMSELIILTACRTLQGQEVRKSMTSRFAKLYEDLDGGFTPINFMFPNLPLPSYRRRDRAQKEMSDFYLDIMRRRREGEGIVGIDTTTELYVETDVGVRCCRRSTT
jgi:sterol 14-demethylase